MIDMVEDYDDDCLFMIVPVHIEYEFKKERESER